LQQEYTRAMPKRLIIAVSRNGILLMKIPETFTEGTMVRVLQLWWKQAPPPPLFPPLPLSSPLPLRSHVCFLALACVP
jgi:hypothetical protein